MNSKSATEKPVALFLFVNKRLGKIKQWILLSDLLFKLPYY